VILHPTLPYVYKLTDRETGHFYIGFRCSNKVCCTEDLGVVYFSSSKYVKSNFSRFEVEIIAEFFDKDSAYAFEQSLIKSHFSNPLILNKHWQSTTVYTMLGFKRPDVSHRNSLTKRKQKVQREYLCTWCRAPCLKLEFEHHQPRTKCFCNATCRNRFSAQHRPSTKGVKKPHLWGRPTWNKGKPNHKSADNGKRGAATQSRTVTGRKRKYVEDGKWTWEYPEKLVDSVSKSNQKNSGEA
jgi:hypothetical protein